MPHRITIAFTLLLAAAACGDSDKKTCSVEAQTGCDSGKVCENVSGGSPACFEPVVLTGRVFDLASSAAIPGARLVALDANRSPVSAVALSSVDGSYSLALPRDREASGAPVGGPVTLRADATGYQSFPSGLRQALPIDTSAAVQGGGSWTIASSLTDVGLLALPSSAGSGSIEGHVEVPPVGGGVLVVAEPAAGGAGMSAIADRGGDYAVLNLGPGDYAVKAFSRGVNYAPAAVSLAAGETKEADLAIAGATAATVSGNVEIVNRGQGIGTSVILVVESTFDDALVRGDVPPGLRAPEPGTDPDVTGAFSIDGVPDGRYVALAAFEDDFLVRDPDTSIGGTQIVHLEVANGALVSAPPSFKVTGALDVVSPGADGPEVVTSATPTFTWVDDSSEVAYDVTVLDAFGVEVWRTTIPGVSGSPTVSVVYGQAGGTPASAPALQSGMYYQFRVLSRKNGGSPISQTEDLKGVFLVE
jgi:hypothetical protein